ncbi:MFS transporter [Phenylobacterium sp. SCN 70-31]|uniref:MFS transporter n=1 Tax=Phenylobacterium sp. SCN 70-31 TaxID=1660129 RepID=UPI00086976FD|nr:MFS transporter [Phenylobacterium sp. SCN 70-31]ODT89293.1 MAG: MFS transporter [Phenylobacterium sp. SCN 70-31]
MTGSSAEAAVPASSGGGGRLDRGGVAWSVFEGGRNPYVILITIYIFMPYVAASMVGDPVKGQETISRWQQWAGWVVMATAPFIGASVDKLGGRKPWLGLTVGLMVPLTAALWWARPDGTGLSVATTMLFAMTVQVLFAYNEILHNSLLVRAAGLSGAHRASGLALSLGNLFSVLALAFTAWAFALPGQVDWTWVPKAPLFGLDPESHEPERVVALLAAGLLLLGAIPLFLFTPDAPRTGVPVARAFAQGAAQLVRMVRTVGQFRDAAVYLGSRMFFVDGMNGVLVYAGVYAVGVMKWGALEMLGYGILLSIFAVLGGYVGRWLDAGLGPKGALRIEIFMSMLGLLAMLGMRPDLILFLWPYDVATHGPIWDGPVFRTLPDLIFVLVGFSNAIFITAQYASARTLLTRLTPPDQTGAFFGVYALSGVATAWLAPLLVNQGTRITGTQQGGFAMLLVLLVIGFAGLFLVRGGGRVFPMDAASI